MPGVGNYYGDHSHRKKLAELFCLFPAVPTIVRAAPCQAWPGILMRSAYREQVADALLVLNVVLGDHSTHRDAGVVVADIQDGLQHLHSATRRADANPSLRFFRSRPLPPREESDCYMQTHH